jgi:Tfp pilus assembly protein PilV
MTRHSQQQSRLFLLEITLAILFFSLASAVCLRCFAKSHILSTQAAELNQAVSQSENIAELLRSLPENDRKDAQKISNVLQLEYPAVNFSATDMDTDIDTEIDSAQKSWGSWSLYFDSDWNSCQQAQAVYQIQIQAFCEDSVILFHLNAESVSSSLDSSDSIYQLDLKLSAKDF